MNRREILKGLPLATIAASTTVLTGDFATAQDRMAAAEQEYKSAAMALDPTINGWLKYFPEGQYRAGLVATSVGGDANIASDTPFAQALAVWDEVKSREAAALETWESPTEEDHWPAWVQEDNAAFDGLLRAPVQSREEGAAKRNAVHASGYIKDYEVPTEYLEALLSSIA